MNIYKLQYKDKETAIADLIAKGVYTQDLKYQQGIQAVVEIGKVIKENGVYENFQEIIAPIYFEGYAFDVMCENEIDFGTAEIIVKHPKHSFAI